MNQSSQPRFAVFGAVCLQQGFSGTQMHVEGGDSLSMADFGESHSWCHRIISSSIYTSCLNRRSDASEATRWTSHVERI
ncbi:hypothetical protein WJX82_007605 [Trebouxia sp. C0006]